MRLGLGTGSTISFFLKALGRALNEGTLSSIHGVPTSRATETECRALGIPLLELHEIDRLDLAVDGADEVSPELELIKGLGGALLREKMVVQASERFVVIADEGKSVRVLGEKAPVPVEVVRFGWRSHLPHFAALGAEPAPREEASGELFLTDNGNPIVDLYFPRGIESPFELEQSLRVRAGVVETGLFLGMAERAILGDHQGVRILDRPGGGRT